MGLRPAGNPNPVMLRGHGQGSHAGRHPGRHETGQGTFSDTRDPALDRGIGIEGTDKEPGGAGTYQSTLCLVAKSVSMLERHSLLFQIISLIRQLIRLLKQSLYFLLHLILK